ncbi:MAG: hypothetical protein HY553_17055, partial [Elusimicrobia bacterium]|nr:hypothetical protein [Elusimicrobiota bacterium]
YVMLLNNAKGKDWNQEGVYAMFSADLSDPRGWYGLMRLFSGGGWYPQVVGLAAREGTDKLAGRLAKFFMSGRSEWEAVFEQPSEDRRRPPRRYTGEYARPRRP